MRQPLHGIGGGRGGERVIGTPFRRNKGDAVSETLTPQHGPRERHTCDQDTHAIRILNWFIVSKRQYGTPQAAERQRRNQGRSNWKPALVTDGYAPPPLDSLSQGECGHFFFPRDPRAHTHAFAKRLWTPLSGRVSLNHLGLLPLDRASLRSTCLSVCHMQSLSLSRRSRLH